MRMVPTFTANIYVGLKHRPTGRVFSAEKARRAIREYVDSVGLCVTLTRTEYIYTNGSEPGFIVGLINYPRFPSTPEQIEAHAIELGKRLRKACKQFKVSIVFPHKTVMLGSAK